MLLLVVVMDEMDDERGSQRHAWNLRLSVHTGSSFESRVVFLYDVWAERLQFFQKGVSARSRACCCEGSHYHNADCLHVSVTIWFRVCFRQYKVRIHGLGLVESLSEVGSEDTEDRQPCFVVAEKHLLLQALKCRAGIFQLPRGLRIDVTFQEPQRMAGNQLHYLAPKTIHSRDLRAGTPLTACSPVRPLRAIVHESDSVMMQPQRIKH